MALTTRIKEYREMQDLKQSDLAELVGVRRETMRHYASKPPLFPSQSLRGAD